APLLARAQRTGAMVMFRPYRRALSTREHRRTVRETVPLPIGAKERPLGRPDALQRALRDGHGATGDHLAVHVATTEIFFVIVALFVPIIDPRHGRVPPIHDANARLRVEVGRLAD